MFYDILDKKRRELLPRLKNLKEQFFLAGGTGLALHLGHRASVDFDFFCHNDFDTAQLFQKMEEIFAGFEIKKIQEEKNTLTILVNGIKLSFLKYPYPLAGKPIEQDYIKIAAIIDVCLMKLATIVSRATMKDYVDLYYIFQNLDLNQVLGALKKTIPDLEENLVRKSLVYFNDLKEEPIDFKNSNYASFTDIKDFLKKITKKAD